jgi:hypothetical protein
MAEELIYTDFNASKLAVKGNKDAHSEFMKSLGGKWNSKLEGWVVNKDVEDNLKEYIDSLGFKRPEKEREREREREKEREREREKEREREREKEREIQREKEREREREKERERERERENQREKEREREREKEKGKEKERENIKEVKKVERSGEKVKKYHRAKSISSSESDSDYSSSESESDSDYSSSESDSESDYSPSFSESEEETSSSSDDFPSPSPIRRRNEKDDIKLKVRDLEKRIKYLEKY